jgi:hypothetical protein
MEFSQKYRGSGIVNALAPSGGVLSVWPAAVGKLMDYAASFSAPPTQIG